MHIGLPWGIDRVKRVPVDRFREVAIGFIPADVDDRDKEIPSGQLLTGDHNLINVHVVVQYAVNPDHVEQFAQYGDLADGLVARAAETVVAEWVAGRRVDEVLLRRQCLAAGGAGQGNSEAGSIPMVWESVLGKPA